MNSKKSVYTYPQLRKPIIDATQDLGSDDDSIVCSSGGTSLAINILLIFSIALMFYAVLKITSSSPGSKEWFLEISIVSLVWLAVYIVTTFYHYKSVYLFSTAYVIALFLFHLGITIQQAFGANIPVDWGVIKFPNFEKWLDLSGWYTVLSIAGFGIGVSMSSLITTKKMIANDTAQKRKELVYKAAFWSGTGLLIASVIFFFMALSSYGNLMNYTRAEIFSSSADSRGFGVFMMVFPGAVSILLFSSTTKKSYMYSAGLCVFAFLLFMLSGYRSAALFTSLIGVVIWVKTGRKFPPWLAFSSVIFILLAISFVGVLRTLGAYGSLGDQEFDRSLENTTLTGGIKTMGQTGGALAHVIRLVPDEDPFRYGGSYLHALADSLPNVGFNVDTSFSRKTMKDKGVLDQGAVSNMVPSDWLTYRVLKEQFDLGHGTGFTTIGEAYLNFGLPGVIVFFIIVGCLLGVLDHKKIIYNPYLFIFSCTMLWTLIRTVRNDFSNFIKPSIFVLIILLIFWVVSMIVLDKKIKS